MGERLANDVTAAITAPQPDPRASLLGELDRLSPLEQLRFAFNHSAQREGNNAVTIARLRSRAIHSALYMSPRDRERTGIRLVAVMPSSKDDVEQDPHTTYNVFAAFPHGDSYRFISSSNPTLQIEAGLDRSGLDDVVMQQVDEIREEAPLERHRRLAQEIKRLDRAIALAHRPRKGQDGTLPPLRTAEPEEYQALNNFKKRRVHAFLRTSLELQHEYPQLRGLLFRSSRTEDDQHIEVSMTPVREGSRRDRLYDADTRINVLGAADFSMSTNLKIETLLEGYQQFRDELGSAPDHAAVSAGICQIVGIAPEALPVVVVKPEPVSEPQPMIATEPTLPEEAVLTNKQPLSRKAKKHASKLTKAKIRGERSGTPQLPATTMHFASFADIKGLFEDTEFLQAIAAEAPPEATDVEEATLTPGNVIRTLLETDSTERQAMGIDVQMLVSGPRTDAGELIIEHPGISQYTVSVLIPDGRKTRLIQATRNQLLLPDERSQLAFTELDQLIAAGAEYRPETATDRYNRAIAEIQVVDEHIAALRTQESTDEIRGQLKQLNTVKKSLLLAYFLSADELSETHAYLPQLWIPFDDSSGAYAHLALYKVHEKNQVHNLKNPDDPLPPDGIEQPPIEVKLNIKSQQQRKRLGHDDTDVKIARFLERDQFRVFKEHADQIPRELEGFMQLSLGDMFRRAYEAIQRSRSGEMDRSVANSMQRIAIRRSLLATSFERQGIDIFVVGPLDGTGKVIVEDPVIAQYLVYTTFPWKEGKKFFDIERSLLAVDPLSTTVPILPELLQLDRVVRKEAKGVAEEPYEIYNRVIYQIRFIESQIKVLFDQKTLEGPTNKHIENVIDQLQKRKIPLVAQYFDLAGSLAAQQPDLGRLFDLQQRDADKDTLRMHSIIDRNIRVRLLGNTTESELQTTTLPFETQLNYHRLQQYAADYEAGDTSPFNSAAVVILERLGIARKEVKRPQSDTALATLGTVLLDRPEVRRSSASGRSEQSAALEIFSELPLAGKLDKASQHLKQAIRREFDPRTATLEQRILMRDALLVTEEEREAAGIYLFALGPLDESGVMTIDDHRSSQYAFYLTYFADGAIRTFETYRTNLAENPFDNALPSPDELVFWDSAVHQGAALWQEGNVQIYNRLILEARQTEILLRNTDILAPGDAWQFADRKVALLDSYFLYMQALQAEDPGLGELCTVDREFVSAYPVLDRNIGNILWQETDQSRLAKKNTPTKIRYRPEDRERYKAYFSGNSV